MGQSLRMCKQCKSRNMMHDDEVVCGGCRNNDPANKKAPLNTIGDIAEALHAAPEPENYPHIQDMVLTFGHSVYDVTPREKAGCKHQRQQQFDKMTNTTSNFCMDCGHSVGSRKKVREQDKSILRSGDAQGQPMVLQGTRRSDADGGDTGSTGAQEAEIVRNRIKESEGEAESLATTPLENDQ